MNSGQVTSRINVENVVSILGLPLKQTPPDKGEISIAEEIPGYLLLARSCKIGTVPKDWPTLHLA